MGAGKYTCSYDTCPIPVRMLFETTHGAIKFPKVYVISIQECMSVYTIYRIPHGMAFPYL